MKNNLIAFVVFLSLFNTAFANVTLPNVFSDNMVLQRNTEVTIWGWANPQEEVVITPSWNNQTYKIQASNQAKWEINIPTPKEGGPFSISIKGYNEVVLKNILIGEVWICSGQSNMEMNASWGIENGDEAVKNATNPNIRFFTVPKLTATTPQNNLSGNWTECTPETMKYFSAVGYFFAKRLQEDLKNVPIVIGKISDSGDVEGGKVWKFGELVQYGQEKFAATQPNVAIVRTTNSYKYSDRYHYDNNGFIDLGKQFATKIFLLNNKMGNKSKKVSLN